MTCHNKHWSKKKKVNSKMNRVMIYKKSKKNKNKNQFIGINKINSNESFSQKKTKKSNESN